MTTSVIIPLYNKAQHIRRAIDSVLAQTCGDFELVVVDDGSTDASAEMVRGYHDSRIRLISQENAGVSAARNRGIAEAKTNLIALLDADDEWSVDFLQTVLALREQFPNACVWGTAYAELDVHRHVKHLRLPEDIRRQTTGCLINFFRLALADQPCNASSSLVRKDALIKAGGFMVSLARLEDTDMLFRMALRYPVAYCPLAKAVYHLEADNRSDEFEYTGNYPFYRHAQEYLHERGAGIELDKDVSLFIDRWYFGGLRRNWQSGNHAAMREVLRVYWPKRGYLLKCCGWFGLSLIPHSMVCWAWRIRRQWRGLSDNLPIYLQLYRSSQDRRAP
jgi:glycosyltransferase involved in cell wall biosynthesis